MKISPYSLCNPYAHQDMVEAQRQNAAWDRALRVEEREAEILADSELFAAVVEFIADRKNEYFVSALREAANGRGDRLRFFLRSATTALAMEQVK